MLNSLYTRFNSTLHPFFTVCVCSYVHSVLLCSAYNLIYLFLSKLWVITIFTHTKNTSGGCDFYKVSAILIALPYCLSCVIYTVYNTLGWARVAHIYLFKTISRICVASCGSYGLFGSINTRTSSGS